LTTKRGVLAAVGAALILAPISVAGSRTTAPSTSATVVVLLRDTGIEIAAYAETQSANAATLGMMRGAIPRGDVLHFNVINRGKKLHNFVVFGRKTKVLKPGQRAKFQVMATTRGNFPYRSTLDKGKAFRGFVSIF
jgi:hypothetical protein